MKDGLKTATYAEGKGFLSPIDEIIEDLRNGRMIILVDAEDRESLEFRFRNRLQRHFHLIRQVGPPAGQVRSGGGTSCRDRGVARARWI